jgi:hypothetical protein
MNSNYFLESVDKYLTEKDLWTCTRSADCLEAIAKCIRIIASTAPALGAIILTGIKLCRGEASLAIARILEKFATDIRLEASRKGCRNQSLDSENIQKSVSG